jgi:hypothetical protein
MKSSPVDTLKGGNIYRNLRNFIKVGESGAEIVQTIMRSISKNNLNRTVEFDFVSDEDKRTKHCKVEKKASYDGVNYQFKLTIHDKGYAAEPDKGIALQVFWNSSPIEGVALLKFKNINSNNTAKLMNAMAKIEYNETKKNGYDQEMIVSISALPLYDISIDPYSMSTLKLFVGKTGDILDIRGNSNHPNAWFVVEDEKGVNWAFVASSDCLQNIGVAHVGLPPSNSAATDRTTLLETYSIKNVFQKQIKKKFPFLNQSYIDAYLYHTNAPGYFANQQFVQSGTQPNANYAPLYQRTTTLVPYQPASISSLSISFQ